MSKTTQTDQLTPYSAGTKEASIAELTEAFQVFSAKTAHLEKAYNALKGQFRKVNLQLEESNLALSHKVNELDHLSKTLNSILGNMTQGLVFLHLDGEVTVCNPSAERILGKTSQELVGRKFWDIFSDDLLGFSMKETLASSTPLDSYQHRIEILGLAPRDVQVTVSFLLTDSAPDRGAILLIRDITEVRRWELLAQRSDRLKELGEMAATMAHEIRNPLGGIKGFASLLYRDLKENPKSQELAKYIVDGSETLDRLVNNILHYSRPVYLTLDPGDVKSLIQEVTRIVEADEKLATNITVKLHLPESPLIAPIDGGLLRAALLNLIVNASDAMPNGGEVTITLQNHETDAEIRVKDQGVGIPQESLEKIFSPFFTTKIYGNGFGLSEVYRTLRAHGGTVDVESEVEKGTEFILRFPRKEEAPSPL